MNLTTEEEWCEALATQVCRQEFYDVLCPLKSRLFRTKEVAFQLKSRFFRVKEVAFQLKSHLFMAKEVAFQLKSRLFRVKEVAFQLRVVFLGPKRWLFS